RWRADNFNLSEVIFRKILPIFTNVDPTTPKGSTMPEFTHMHPDTITVAHFNPARRTQRSGLGGLMISIQQHGILEPLALTRDGVRADGHRRLACAKLVKMTV